MSEVLNSDSDPGIWKKALPFVLAGSTALAGCGGKTVVDGPNAVDVDGDSGMDVAGDSSTDVDMDSGIDAELDSGVDSEVDAEISEDLLTRRVFAQDLVKEVMGFNGDCAESRYLDVSVSDELCFPAEILYLRDADKGYSDANGQFLGKFGPSDKMTRSQVWKVVAKAIGLAAYDAPCLNDASDVTNEWFAIYGGAVCDKGLPFADNGLARPSHNMTIAEWGDFRMALNQYLDQDITRAGLVELDVVEFYDQGVFYDTSDCVSVFPDVQNGTLECQTTNIAYNNGLISGFPNGEFDPDGSINYAELSKATVQASALEPVIPPNGCSGNDPESWYAQYMDALCPYSVHWNPADDVVSRDAYWVTWNVKMSE